MTSKTPRGDSRVKLFRKSAGIVITSAKKREQGIYYYTIYLKFKSYMSCKMSCKGMKSMV